MTKKTTISVGGISVSEVAPEGLASGVWMIDIPPHMSPTGKRRRLRRKSKTAAVSDARSLVMQFKLDQRLGYDPNEQFTLNDIFPMWHTAEKKKLAAGRKKASSLRTDLNGIKHILNFMGDDLITRIDEERIVEYQAHRRQEGIRPVTVNTELRKLRLLLSWSARKRVINAVPRIDFLPEPQVNTEVPTPEELVRIIEELPNDRAILTRLMAETGLRPSEAFRLKWAKVDLATRTLRVGDDDVLTSKTEYSDRSVRFGVGLAEDLATLRSESPFVFPSSTDPLKPMDNYRKALSSAIERAGVKRMGETMKFSPKYARKAFTSYQWLRGVSLEVIRKQVGHSPNSRVTVKHYLHMPEEVLDEAVLDVYELPAVVK